MAIQSMQLDPNAATYTDDQIVAKVNAATTKVAAASLAAGAAKTSLDAMADTARGYIKTAPTVGEFPIVSLQRAANGKLDADYDDVSV